MKCIHFLYFVTKTEDSDWQHIRHVWFVTGKPHMHMIGSLTRIMKIYIVKCKNLLFFKVKAAPCEA